jgi:hypothetical protein
MKKRLGKSWTKISEIFSKTVKTDFLADFLRMQEK